MHGQFLRFSEPVLLCAVLSLSTYVPFSWKVRKVSRTRHSLKFYPCQTQFLRSQCLVPDKLNNLHPFVGAGGGGHQVSVPSVKRPVYTPITWRMCLVPNILVRFRD